LLLQEVFRQGPSVPYPMPSDALVGSYVGCYLPSGKRTDIRETARRCGSDHYPLLGWVHIEGGRDLNR
jgi:hypothetical protein